MFYLYIGIGIAVMAIAVLIYIYFGNRISRYQKKLQFSLHLKDYITAIEFARKLIATHPRSPEYHFQLADIYLKAKMHTSAIDTYRNMLNAKIFSVTIRDFNIRERLALINLEQGKIAEAYQELYRIYKTNSNSPLALSLLGRIYGSQRKYTKAEELLKKACNLKPKDAENHYTLGILFLDMGDLANGYAELDKTYQLDPSHVKAAYFLALASKQKGLEEKAKILLQKLNLTDIKKLPDNITQVGILAQNMTKFDIDQAEEQINQEFSQAAGKKDENVATNIHDLLHGGVEIFTTTAYYIIDKMGYLIQKDIKSRFFDPANEIDVLAIPKKDKDNPEAHKYYIQFNKSKSELGAIPFHDFIEKVNESNVRNGVLIITSSFNPKILEELSKIKKNIILVDGTKLSRYF